MNACNHNDWGERRRPARGVAGRVIVGRVVVVVAALLMVACGKGKPGPPVDDPPAYLRAAIRAEPKNCFQHELAFCLDDVALIDEAIDKAARGKALPKDRRKLDRLAKSAAMSYRLSMMKTPERRRAIHKLMVKRFAAPVVKVQGDMVAVDLGVVPSGIVKGMRTGYELSTQSPLLEGSHGLSSVTFAKTILSTLASHPNAKAIAVYVRAKTRSGALLRQRIIYSVGHAIETKAPLRHWISKTAPTADLSAYLNGEASIYRDRVSCDGQQPPARCGGGPARNFDWFKRDGGRAKSRSKRK